MNLKYIFGCLIIFIYSCDPIQTLKINNRRNEDIFVSISFDGNLLDYPIRLGQNGDTLWHLMEYAPQHYHTIMPVIGKTGWRDAILRNSADSSLTIFLYERSLLELINKDSILPDSIYSKKIKYKLAELENLNWQIEYK